MGEVYLIPKDELYHHGIKGMKWGVRRFQKKDGSLTPAGKKRYADSSDKKQKSPSAHRVGLEKRYRDKGMSAEEAKAAADKRIRVEKVVAATAAVTITACAAYYAKNKWTQTYCDQVLKAGTTFHNLDSTANYRPDQHLYVNYRQNDINYFRGHFAVNKMRKTGSVFNHTVTANDDIKIPSINTRKNVFKQLYDNDVEFRKTFDDHSRLFNSSARQQIGLQPKEFKPRSASKVYKSMWMKFGDKDDPDFNVAKRKYFDALRAKGYDAIVDEWDTNKRVFRSDAPLILLNTSSKSFGDMSIKELTGRDILLSQANSKNYSRGRDWLNALHTPHTNHFTESSKHLSRYAAKTAKNEKYIDKFLEKAGESYNVKDAAKNRMGALMAEAGKYLSKNNNMTVSEAMQKAKTKAYYKDTTEDTIKTIATIYAPLAVATRASNDRLVKQYLKEHPNTKKTYNEIVRIKKQQKR